MIHECRYRGAAVWYIAAIVPGLMMLLVRGRLRAIGAFDMKEIWTATLVPSAGPGSHTRSRISRRNQWYSQISAVQLFPGPCPVEGGFPW